MSAAREADYISTAKQHTKALWDAYHALKAMQTEWSALDYGTTLDDGAGANAGLTKTEVGAVVFATVDELTLRIFATGHATNLAKLL